MPGIFPAPARVKIALPHFPKGAGCSLPLFVVFYAILANKTLHITSKTDKIIKKAAMA